MRHQKGEFNVLKKHLLMIITALIGGLILAGCNTNVIKGSGTLKTETRSVTDFTSVEANGMSTVTFLAGSEVSVIVEADDNLLPLLESRVENGVLHLGAKDGILITEGTVRYTVMYRALDGIVLSGSATAEALEVDQEQLLVTLSGSGTLTLAGQANNLNLIQSGSSTLNAFLLTVQEVDATLSASSNAELTIHDSLKAVLSGSASLVHRGDATNIQQTVSGSATIQKSS